MPKKLAVNGRTVWVEEEDFDDVCEMFKENVTVVDLEKGNGAIHGKARHYLSLSPPDLVQSAEKTWFAAVYAVKKLYLTCGGVSSLGLFKPRICGLSSLGLLKRSLSLPRGRLGVDLKSHNSLKFFARFAIKHAELSDDVFWHLHDSWTKAEKMYRDVYGSCNFRVSEYAQIISDVETFVLKFEAFDRKSLWIEFDKAFISGNNPDVVIRKESHSINLGGSLFKCDYSVFV
ncbi:unnamed protein product [Caenorhabditis bovis]|uniref:Uncharacterized protein n=1 Tax=Caenorhabditis bovis TaxID=2654633 RepID=A0A8S1EXI3_9PELO|nr:unnamed protein product [Caenorhabditis bovis]